MDTARPAATCRVGRRLACIAGAALLVGGPAHAQRIVSPEGPYRTVGEAVRAARPGERIVVRAGEYREPTIVVDRPVEITGEPGAVLDGEGARQVLTITADSVTVRGLHVRNVGVSYVEDRAGIAVEGARHCLLEGNRIEQTFFAIYLARVADCRIVGNQIDGRGRNESQTGNGIHLWYSRDIVIERNHVAGHRDGIYFEFVEDSRVTGNRSERNLRYGLHFMFSDRCAYHRNRFRENGAGVAVMYTRRVEMVGNRFEENRGRSAFGILLKDISDSRIADNLFLRNTVGLYAEGSNRVLVEGNRFHGNGYAVRILANSVDNRFTGNAFTGNSFDVTTNSRQSFSRFEGNYWDRYAGYDLDRDGFGDVPHRPVSLFAMLVERNPPALVLLRSLFVDVLDAAERVFPALTPQALADGRPRMRWAP